MPRKSQKAALSLVSPAARAGTADRLAGAIPSEVQISVDKFEAAIGGRPKLVEALAAAETAPEVQTILGILGDPQYDTWPLVRICREAGITPGQLFSAFKAAAIARATVLAMLAAADAIPAVTQEVLKTAVPHDAPCRTCNGTGTIHPEPTKKDPTPTPTTCHSCQGVGSFRVDGSLDHQQMAFELTGLIKKSSGTTVAVQTNVQPTTVVSGGYLEQIQQAGSELLYGRPVSQPTVSVVDVHTSEEGTGAAAP